MLYFLCLPEMKGGQHELPSQSALPRKSEKIFLMCALQANIFNATVHFAKRIKTNGHTYTKQIRAGLPNTKKSYAINLAPF